MSVEDNKILALQFFKAAGTGDRDLMAKIIAEDATWFAPRAFCEHIAPLIGLKLPESGVVSGRDAIFQDLLAPLRSLFNGSPGTFRIDDVVAEGDKVLVLEHTDAIGKNGAPYSNDYAFIFEIRDGQIVGVRELFDSWYAFATLFEAC